MELWLPWQSTNQKLLTSASQVTEILKLALQTESKLTSLHLNNVEDVDTELFEEANNKLNIKFADSEDDDSETDDSEAKYDYDAMFHDDDDDDDEYFNFGRFQGGYYSHGDAMGFPRYSSEWHHFEDKYFYSSD